jgi:hypothetical protein
MSHTFTNKQLFEVGTREGVIKGWRTRRGASGQTQKMRDIVSSKARNYKKSLSAPIPYQGGLTTRPRFTRNILVKDYIRRDLRARKESKRNWKADVYGFLGMKKVKGNLGGTYYE